MQFNVPVVLFMFKRKKAVDVVRRISQIKPQKLYLLADYGRNEEEIGLVEECRRAVEQEINWDCEIIKNYATANRGVYENIGEGAKWVLKREKWAIFLEDDNLPELTFFEFCKEMLHKYENDTRILWICVTNYLGDYQASSGDSYVFTRHMLPCGWASWATKFERFYCGDLSLCDDSVVMDRIKRVYHNNKIFHQYKRSWMSEYDRIKAGKKTISWDYQMDFSIKVNNLFGICPCKNQIKNIGVDECSIHGGSSFDMIMTKRFCGMDSFPIQFPLKHPSAVLTDPVFEKKIGKIVLYPWRMRFKAFVSAVVRRMFRVPKNKRIIQYIKDGFK